MRRIAKTSAFAAIVFLASCVAHHVVAGDIDDEYLDRFKSLAAKDVNGHFELAKWCREHEKWQLVAQQCRHVLRIEPNHEQAKLLLQVAQTRLSADQALRGRDPDASGRLRPLTDEEVQRIRRKELHLDEEGRVVVRIDRDALREFYEFAHGTGLVDDDRRAFFKLPRLKLAQLILRLAPDQFGKAVSIRSDPQRMQTFIRDVQPIILRGCAAADCHGGSAAGDFQLFTGRALSPNASYANYLRMHEHKAGNERLINRDQPGRSLLLSYGLPNEEVAEETRRHPSDIMPVFQSPDDREYRTVLNWLSSLSIRRPDYGIELKSDETP
jgi:hypothetical protein